jgi:hypothetical protein
MATGTLVLCKPLCFLVTKIGKLEQKVIKTALLDYYNSAEITAAKMQLLQDVANLDLSRSSPHIPQRREGETRSVLEIDDIFKVIDFLDELKLLHQLPKYVTDNPDSMPSIRLFEGDLSHILSRMERIENRLENKITGIYSSVAAIAHDIGVINNAIHGAVEQNWPALSSQQPSTRPSGVSRINLEKPTRTSTVNHGGVEAKNSHQASNVYKQQPQQANEVVVIHDLPWSARCSTPARKSAQHFATHSVTNKPSMSSDSELTDHIQDSTDDRPYIVQRSRKKRLGSPKQDEGGQPVITNATRRGPLVIGASTPSKHTGSNIKAANRPTIPRKSIFCVGNVDPTCSVEDMCDHVTAMSVRVISCFEAKPRRRRTDNEYEEIVDRRAFRLCVNSDDVDNMLDPAKWPAHVYVSEWFFKSASAAPAPAAKKRRQSTTRAPQSPPSNTAQDNAHRMDRIADSLGDLLNKDVNIFETLNNETILQEDTGDNEPMAEDDATILEITVEPDNGSTT